MIIRIFKRKRNHRKGFKEFCSFIRASNGNNKFISTLWLMSSQICCDLLDFLILWLGCDLCGEITSQMRGDLHWFGGRKP